MSFFCCEQVCNETSEEIVYSHRSNYKLNNYSSQSTDSQSLSQVMRTPSPQKQAQRPVVTVIRPSIHSQIRHENMSNPFQIQQTSRFSLRQPKVLKPQTPINDLVDYVTEDSRRGGYPYPRAIEWRGKDHLQYY